MTKLTPLPKLLKKAERVFNAYVRQRDKNETCISCGKPGNQAGHYFTVKQFSALRFHHWNVNLQCAYCNLFAHGNQAMYRIGLVRKIGEYNVIQLEQIAMDNRIKKWTRKELNEIIEKYG